MTNSSLLLNKKPLMVNPDLAVLIGLSESIVIQQIHYWVKKNEEEGRNFYDGYYWTYNSYPEWQKQFPFWNVSTVQKIFTKLVKRGLLITGNYNKIKLDRTKWYRIDYKLLDGLSKAENCPSSKNCEMHLVNLTPTIPETNTETNRKYHKGFLTKTASFSKFIDLVGLDDEETISAVSYYLKTYKKHTNRNHPNLKVEQWETVINNLFEAEDGYSRNVEFELEEMLEMIDLHFTTDYGNCDYNILHFLSGDIRLNRYYDIIR